MRWWPLYTNKNKIQASGLLVDIYYWFMYRLHPKHRYNIVRTGLPPGYYDIDTLMIHAMFALLVRYVEIEREGAPMFMAHIQSLKDETFDLDADFYAASAQIQIAYEEEALTLYYWWTLERDKRSEETDEEIQRNENEDTEMMCRLVRVRGSLWT